MKSKSIFLRLKDWATGQHFDLGVLLVFNSLLAFVISACVTEMITFMVFVFVLGISEFEFALPLSWKKNPFRQFLKYTIREDGHL